MKLEDYYRRRTFYEIDHAFTEKLNFSASDSVKTISRQELLIGLTADSSTPRSFLF